MPDGQPGSHEGTYTAPRVRVQSAVAWEEFEERLREGDRSLLESPSSSVFSTPEWLGAYWRAYGQGRETKCILFVADGDAVVGMAGLCSDSIKARLGKRVRRLCFIGDGTHDSALLDLIVRRGFEQSCSRAFVDWLSSQDTWDLCELGPLSKKSANLAELLSDLSERRWRHRSLAIPSSAISLPDSWEKYLSQIPRKERTKVRSRMREVEERFRVSFTKCTDEEALPAALGALFDLHQKRWNERGLSGAFSSAERRAFYQEMARSFLRRGSLELWQMKLDDKPVAAQIGIRHQDTVHILQKGFDPEYSGLSVGYVLETHVIKTLIAERVVCYDYLRGAETSKLRMGALPSHYVTLEFARPFSVGALLLSLDELSRAAKARLREALPPGLFALLKKVFYRLAGKREAGSEEIRESAEGSN